MSPILSELTTRPVSPSTSLWAGAAVLAAVLIALIAAFAVWLSKQTKLEPKDRAAYWDVFLKTLAAFAASLAIVKYFDDKQTTAQRADHERWEQIVERRATAIRDRIKETSAAYAQLGDALSKLLLVESLKVEPGLTAFAEFDRMYYVRLIGIESRTVEADMVQLRRELLKWRANDKDKPSKLEQAVMGLREDCEEDVRNMKRAIEELYEGKVAPTTAPASLPGLPPSDEFTGPPLPPG